MKSQNVNPTQPPNYPGLKRIIDGLNLVFLKMINGFGMGVGYAILLTAFLPPNNLVVLMTVLGCFFAFSQGVKAVYQIHRQNQHERHLIKLLGKPDYLIFKEDQNPIHKFQRYAKQFNQSNKRLISFFNYLANGMGLVGLFFFFSPFYAALFLPATKIMISLAAGLFNAALGMYYKYYLCFELKDKIRYIENFSMPFEPPPYLYAYKHTLNKSQIFKKITFLEKFGFLGVAPIIDFLITATTGTATIFGILVLFCIGFSLSLPWLPPVTALITSACLGFGMAIRKAVDTYNEQKIKVKYINYVVDQYEARKFIQTYYYYYTLKNTFTILDDKDKITIKHTNSLKYLWSFINGASNGIGFTTSVISIYLFATATAANPILLSIIFLAGVLCGCLNIYKDYFSKGAQKEKIDYYRYQLNKRYINYIGKPVKVIRKAPNVIIEEVETKSSHLKYPLKSPGPNEYEFLEAEPKTQMRPL